MTPGRAHRQDGTARTSAARSATTRDRHTPDAMPASPSCAHSDVFGRGPRRIYGVDGTSTLFIWCGCAIHTNHRARHPAPALDCQEDGSWAGGTSGASSMRRIAAADRARSPAVARSSFLAAPQPVPGAGSRPAGRGDLHRHPPAAFGAIPGRLKLACRRAAGMVADADCAAAPVAERTSGVSPGIRREGHAVFNQESAEFNQESADSRD